MTMYLEHFGLREAPFRITPHTEFFFSGANRGATLEALSYAITAGEGMVKVTGEVGSGKTMLCRVLMERLPDTVETIYLAVPSLSRDEMLAAIAGDLGIDTTGAGTNKLVRSLQEKLIEIHAAGRQVVTLIDEAHAMPLATLEEIRLLSNLETGTEKLLQIVLSGQPELEEPLALPRMRQTRERITHSFTWPAPAARHQGLRGLPPARAAPRPDLFGPRCCASSPRPPRASRAASTSSRQDAARGVRGGRTRQTPPPRAGHDTHRGARESPRAWRRGRPLGGHRNRSWPIRARARGTPPRPGFARELLAAAPARPAPPALPPGGPAARRPPPARVAAQRHRSPHPPSPAREGAPAHAARREYASSCHRPRERRYLEGYLGSRPRVRRSALVPAGAPDAASRRSARRLRATWRSPRRAGSAARKPQAIPPLRAIARGRTRGRAPRRAPLIAARFPLSARRRKVGVSHCVSGAKPL
jgi:type II secretory pathway predicted ATPase ExeA